MCQSPDLPVNANQRADLSTGAGSVLALGRPQLLRTLHLQPLRRQARSRVHQVAQDHQLPTQVRPLHQDPLRPAHILVPQGPLPHPAHIQVPLLLHQTPTLVPLGQSPRQRPTRTAVPLVNPHPLTQALLVDRQPPPQAVTQAQVEQCRVRKDQWGRTLILIPMERRSVLP